MSDSKEQRIKDFWNQRASLGDLAGTNDFVLSDLEQNFLKNTIERGSRVLDIGCGNGSSLILLSKNKKCSGIGLDFSESMIHKAIERLRETDLSDHLAIYQAEIPPVSDEWGTFDVVYSQRCLINLGAVAEQKEAVLSIEKVLNPGGIYIMLECFNEGSQETNLLRRRLGLEPIKSPWHNLFFDLHEVKSWSSQSFYVEKVVHISSTYHFISRVIYAKLAEQTGQQLVYDSDLNIIASRLPQEIGEFGPVKACIWRKAS